MNPRQTKVTSSHLGKPHPLFLSLGKPRQKTMFPFWGASFFLSVGRRPVGAASFASLAHVPVHLQRRDVRGEERNCGKKREVLRRSRTPSPSAAHRARHRHAPKATAHGVLCTFARERAPARPVFSVFCLHSFTSLATSSISAGYGRKNGEGKVKVVKALLATACDSVRYDQLLTFCRVRRKHKVRCFSKMGR